MILERPLPFYKKVPPKPYPSQTFIVRCGREPSLAPAVPVIKNYLECLDQELVEINSNYGLSRKQKLWLGFCLSAITEELAGVNF